MTVPDNFRQKELVGETVELHGMTGVSHVGLLEWRLDCKHNGLSFAVRAFPEHAATLEKIGAPVPDVTTFKSDYSKAPYSIVLGYDAAKRALRMVGAMNANNEKVEVEAPEIPKYLAKPIKRHIEIAAVPVMVNGRLVSPADLPPSPVIVPTPAPAIAPSPELSIEARLARMLQDAEAIYSAMPSAMTAQLLFNARYLNGIKPQSEKALVEAHLLSKIGTQKVEAA